VGVLTRIPGVGVFVAVKSVLLGGGLPRVRPSGWRYGLVDHAALLTATSREKRVTQRMSLVGKANPPLGCDRALGASRSGRRHVPVRRALDGSSCRA
jgi:hypothetical protein